MVAKVPDFPNGTKTDFLRVGKLDFLVQLLENIHHSSNNIIISWWWGIVFAWGSCRLESIPLAGETAGRIMGSCQTHRSGKRHVQYWPKVYHLFPLPEFWLKFRPTVLWNGASDFNDSGVILKINYCSFHRCKLETFWTSCSLVLLRYVEFARTQTFSTFLKACNFFSSLFKIK